MVPVDRVDHPGQLIGRQVVGCAHEKRGCAVDVFPQRAAVRQRQAAERRRDEDRAHRRGLVARRAVAFVQREGDDAVPAHPRKIRLQLRAARIVPARGEQRVIDLIPENRGRLPPPGGAHQRVFAVGERLGLGGEAGRQRLAEGQLRNAK